MKNKEIEDLEKELAGLESDEDDGGDAGRGDDDDDDVIPSVNKHSLPNTTQEKKPAGGSGPSNSFFGESINFKMKNQFNNPLLQSLRVNLKQMWAKL